MTDNTETTTSVPTEEVVLTKESFNKKGKLFKKRTGSVEVPELNPLMGLDDTQTAVVKIQQITLSAYLDIKGDITSFVQTMVDSVLSAAVAKGTIRDEILQYWDKMASEERYRVAVCEQGITDPKLNRSDIVFIAKMFPMVLMRISEEIMELTNKGGDLKKNSKG